MFCHEAISRRSWREGREVVNYMLLGGETFDANVLISLGNMVLEIIRPE